MLSAENKVIMLNVVMLSVVAPFAALRKKRLTNSYPSQSLALTLTKAPVCVGRRLGGFQLYLFLLLLLARSVDIKQMEFELPGLV